MRTRHAAFIGLSLLVCIGAWWLLRPATLTPPSQPMARREGKVIHVGSRTPLSQHLHIDTVEARVMPHHVELPAQLVTAPGLTVNIYAPTTGRVMDIFVRPGQKVQKGERLATLLSGDVAQARADYQKAQSALTFARLAWRRANAVLSVGGNAVKDMQSARNDLEQAEAEATRAHDRLTSLDAGIMEDTPPQLTLTAPVNGVISTITVGKGQNVTDTSNPLLTLLDVNTLWLAAGVPENMLPLLHPGMSLEAHFGQVLCSGPVIAQDPALQAETRRLNLYAACNNDPQGHLHPGQFTVAGLLVPERRQTVLPKTALLMNNDSVSVFVETEPDIYQRRTISITYDEGDSVRVLSGIRAGERVVTHGAVLLNDY